MNTSFADFYTNPHFTGHCFFKPSLKTGEMAQRIVSGVEQDGACSVFAEILTRLVLAIILPLALVLSALSALGGFVVKGSSYLHSYLTFENTLNCYLETAETRLNTVNPREEENELDSIAQNFEHNWAVGRLDDLTVDTPFTLQAKQRIAFIKEKILLIKHFSQIEGNILESPTRLENAKAWLISNDFATTKERLSAAENEELLDPVLHLYQTLLDQIDAQELEYARERFNELNRTALDISTQKIHREELDRLQYDLSNSTHFGRALQAEYDQAQESIDLAEKIYTVQQSFDAVRNQLQAMDRLHIDSKQLDDLENEIESEEIKALLKDPPVKDTGHPLNLLVEEKTLLKTWIIQRREYYERFRNISPNNMTWNHENEIPVPDNGACLFDSAALLSNLNDSHIQLSAHEERVASVNWIGENYQENEELQEFLLNSLAEHIFAQIQSLEEERTNLRSINIENPQIHVRLKEIDEQLTALDDQITLVTLASGGAHDAKVCWNATLSEMTEAYLIEMCNPHAHGGMAELYALSMRHKVCFKIHAKRSHLKEVDAEPYAIMNSEFENDRPARHLTHAGNHYNVYILSSP